MHFVTFVVLPRTDADGLKLGKVEVDRGQGPAVPKQIKQLRGKSPLNRMLYFLRTSVNIYLYQPAI